MTEIEIQGGEQLRQLARELRRLEDGRDRVAQLRRNLKAAAQPLVPAIKAAARSLPSQGQNRARGRRSTRAQLASSVTLQVRTSGRLAGVSVFMNPRKMPDGKKSLPMYFERTPGYLVLRHPTFGRRDGPRDWQNQIPATQGYFSRAITGVDERAERACRAVMEQTARELEDG